MVIQAAGRNPRKLSDCDIANAELSALVVSHQNWSDLRYKKIKALLQFPGDCRVEVEVNLKLTKRRLREYIARARQSGTQTPIPTPVLSYLLTR